MKPKIRYLLGGLFISIIIIAAAAGLWGALYVWPPIIRDSHYRELICDFNRAQSRDEIRRGDEKAGWGFQVQIPESNTTAWVRASSTMGIATIKYSDESAARAVFNHVEYTSPVGLKTTGKILYVHWVEILFQTKHWILAYDLAGRRENTRRRIDPNDLRTGCNLP